MKKNLKLISLIVLIVFVLSTVLAGCGKDSPTTSQTSSPVKVTPSETAEEPDEIDISEHRDLIMLFVGDKVADQDMVYEEINKLAKEDLNCTVTVKNLSWLTISSNTHLFLHQVNNWISYMQLNGLDTLNRPEKALSMK